MKQLNKRSKTVIGYIIIAICFALICVLLVSALALKGEPYDPETFCPFDKEYPHTVILIDKTDSLKKNHQSFVLDYINNEKGKLGIHEKLSVFTLTEGTYIVPESMFSKCNPGTGVDANKLYQNPRKIRLRFDRFFAEPLQDVLKKILTYNVDTKSPLFEMIRELSYREDFGEDVPKRTLIIISDLMHHTSSYSHYRDGLDFKKFANTSYADEVKVHLGSVNVKIVYLLRSNLNKIQGKQHLLFWKNYFQAMGAHITAIRNVR